MLWYVAYSTVSNQGIKAYSMGDYALTEKHLSKALLLNPLSAKTNGLLGIALTRLGRYKEAKEKLLLAISGKRGDSRVRMALGDVYFSENGSLELAEREYLIAVKQPRNDGDREVAWLRLARTYFTQRKHQESLNAINKIDMSSLEFDERCSYVIYKSRILKAMGYYDKGLEEINQFIKTQLNVFAKSQKLCPVGIYLMRGALYDEKQKYKEAIVDYEKALRLKTATDIDSSNDLSRGSLLNSLRDIEYRIEVLRKKT